MHTKLLLAGDVMTGRGIDQVMPHPCDPQLSEPAMHDARDYVRLAERTNGPIPSAVAPDYIWGDALEEIDRFAPDVTVINLETAVTAGGRPWPHKDIHYRMHPDHIACLATARVDVCALANNHVLDYGEEGFSDTLSTLRQAGVATAGAGRNHIEAGAPAIVPLPDGRRLLVFAFATNVRESICCRPTTWVLPVPPNRSARNGVRATSWWSPSIGAPIGSDPCPPNTAASPTGSSEAGPPMSCTATPRTTRSRLKSTKANSSFTAAVT
jgi:poly-gamma-glutamate capsule biosynthesis protein CapA/YwtB (metallophosphatase superfamily)